MKQFLSTTAITAAATLATSVAAQDAQRFDGVTVNLMTFTGPVVSEPLQRRAPDFEKMTGAEINIITVPFADLYSKLLTDWATGTNAVDAAVFAPQWAIDYVAPGFLEDISDRVAADEALDAEGIAPFFREFSQKVNNKTYMVTLDGDFQMVYYRTDVLEDIGKEPPKTWDDYLEIAEMTAGTDLNGDGTADYGSCIPKKRNAQSYWMVSSVMSSFLQSKGTGQGMFFDTEDMTPLMDNPAAIHALEIYKKTGEYGPPDEVNMDIGDTRSLFTTGRCALTLDWGDTGALAFDPDNSQVVDQVGAVILPGSTRVLNRETGEFQQCDAELCPYAQDGVNRAPFAAFGGWSGGINVNADEDVKEAAFAFLSYMSQAEQSNEDVTNGVTGFNPYRMSHLESTDLWVKAGMSEDYAANYIGAIEDSLNSPNMVLDLRIPKNQSYQQVALDTTIARFLAGELDAERTAEIIQTAWEELNDENGVDEQLSAYRATLGIDAE